MKFLVTGVKGQLGYEVVRELSKRGFSDIIGLDIDDMDITNKKMVEEVFMREKPDVVFLCAAYTNSEKAEEDSETCYKVNVTGIENIAKMCQKNGAKLIYISSDYVFDGTKRGLYEISDIPNPLSVYGKTKYEGELKALMVPKHYIVRISWAFGINGNNFVKTMIRVAKEKKEVKVINDQIGSPTYMVDLAIVLVDMALTDKYGIYHVTNEGFCSWYDFAKYIIETNNIKAKVIGISSDEYPSKVKRPKNSCLSKKSLIDNGFNLLPTWEDAIIRYNKELIDKKIEEAK